jgi:hypothetical protein
MRTVRVAVEDLARAKLRGNKRTRFEDVRRVVGLDLGLPDTEVTHKIPWLKRCWENALMNAERIHQNRERLRRKVEAAGR